MIKASPTQPPAWIWLGTLTGVVLWGLSAWLLPTLMGGTDVFVHKGPGCNLAQGLGLTAFGIPSHHPTEADYFAAYPPGLSAVYGLYAWVFGCTPVSNHFFELLIAALASVLLLTTLTPALIHPRSWRGQLPLAALLALVLPSALITTHPDRPELLALIGFLGAVRLAGTRPGLAAFVAGALFWLHPFVSLLTAMATWLLAVLGPNLRTSSPGPLIRRETIVRSLHMVLAFALPVLALWGFTEYQDPDALNRFLTHARMEHTGLIQIRNEQGFWAMVGHSLTISGSYSLSLYAAYGISLLAIAASFAFGRRDQASLIWHLALLIFALLPFAFFAQHALYLAFTHTVLLVIMVLGPREQLNKPVAAVALLIFALAILPFQLRGIWLSIHYHDDYKASRLELAEALRDVPSDALIAAPASHYFLLRPSHHRLLDAAYVSPPPEATDYYLDCFQRRERSAFQSPQTPQGFRRVFASSLPYLDSGLLRSRYLGWRCDLYQRTAR